MTIRHLSAVLKIILRFLLGAIDFLIPKSPSHVSFYCSPLKDFDTNSITLLNQLADNSNLNISVICHDITKTNRLPPKAKIIHGHNIESFLQMARSQTIIFDHSAPPGIFSNRRTSLNVWHGIPIKKIRYLAPQSFDFLYLSMQKLSTTAVIASSHVDSQNMVKAFSLDKDSVWTTGLPRNDWLSNYNTPEYKQLFSDQIDYINELSQGRPIVLYAPTYRKKRQQALYPFSQNEINELSATLEQHNLVMFIKPHSFSSTSITGLSLPENIKLINDSLLHDAVILLSEISLLVTDYSSIWVDFLLTDQPVIGLFYDYEAYDRVDSGMIFDLKAIFPGDICSNIIELNSSIKRAIENPEIHSNKRKESRELFHLYPDGGATDRIINKLKL